MGEKPNFPLMRFLLSLKLCIIGQSATVNPFLVSVFSFNKRISDILSASQRFSAMSSTSLKLLYQEKYQVKIYFVADDTNEDG